MCASVSGSAGWWYHYESRGAGAYVGSPSSVDLSLSSKKLTPDFAQFKLDCSICHPQILADITPGESTIVLKTSAGTPTIPYVVGYAGVESVKNGVLSFDRKNSLLLLGNPLRLNATWSARLIPDNRRGYWDDDSSIPYKVGTKTRNRKIEAAPLQIIVEELNTRHDKGATNFMGASYASLMTQQEITYTTSTSTWENTMIPQRILGVLAAANGPMTIREISSASGCRICEVKPWIKTLEARDRIGFHSRRGRDKRYGIPN